MANLFEKVVSLSTLLDAWKLVHAKGSAGGLDGISIEDFQKDLSRNLDKLSSDLKSGRYAPEPLERIDIPKHDGSGEKRPLSLPSVRDKIVQQAVRLVLEPIFNPIFLDCSYAYRPGKGPRKAFGRVNHYLTTERRRWAALADFDRFFDTLDQDILIRQVAKLVDDPEILSLIRMWIKIGFVRSGGDYSDAEAGIGQGSVISPLLSNIYAHPLDEYMIKQGYSYIRYSDNMIVLSHGRSEAGKGLKDLTEFSRINLKLRLNEEPRPVRSLSEGFVFLGIYYHEDRRAISTGKMAKIHERLKSLIKPGKLPDVLMQKIVRSLEGTARYYSVINPDPQFSEIDRFVIDRMATVLAEFVNKDIFRNTAEIITYLAPIPFLSEGCRTRKDEALKEIASLALRKAVEGKAKSESATQPAKTVTQAVRKADNAVTRRKQRYIRERSDSSDLFVSTHGAFVGKASGLLVVKSQGKLLASVQFEKLKNVLIGTSGVTLSSDVIRECAQRKIGLHFADAHGPPYAMVNATSHPKARLSMAQLEAVKNGEGLSIARRIVMGKIRNQLNLLKFYGRSRGDEADYQKGVDAMELEVEKLSEEAEKIGDGDGLEKARERLFSVEGRAASSYWAMVKLALGKDVEFPGRRRKGATDLVNCLLNYGYAMIYPRVWRAIVLAGLNPHLSFLHAPSDDDPSLAFDMIEEFRSQSVDRAVITMLSRNEPAALDPKQGLLTEVTKRRLITNVLERLTTLVRTKKGHVTLDDVIREQPKRLAHSLLSGTPYRPFIGRY